MTQLLNWKCFYKPLAHMHGYLCGSLLISTEDQSSTASKVVTFKCLHNNLELVNNAQNEKSINCRIRYLNPPRSSIYGSTLLRGSSWVALWSINISVNTKAKTAHSWQKLRPPKFYYGKSHFACSPAYMAIKTSW